MPEISDDTVQQFLVFTSWLSDVYGEETNFDKLLMDADFSEAEIKKLKQEHLSEFLEAVMALTSTYIDLADLRHYMLMVQYHDIIDGSPESFKIIGDKVGVGPERIKQLLNKRPKMNPDSKRKSQFKTDFAAIGRSILDNESS